MTGIIQTDFVKFTCKTEYLSITMKLRTDPRYASIDWEGNDENLEIIYKTEELTPSCEDNKKIKVLLLFKNPHPDSVKNGLFLSESHSRSFWQRLFSVWYNQKLLPLLKSADWIQSVAAILLSGQYQSPFLYHFRCLYSFPTKQFADLKSLFSGAPTTYKQMIVERSVNGLNDYLEKNKISYVIVFFKEGMGIIGGGSLPPSCHVINSAKKAIDQYIQSGDDKTFWEAVPGFKKVSNKGVTFYLNMNTRTKNHQAHPQGHYFTHNLELILRDILKNKALKP